MGPSEKYWTLYGKQYDLDGWLDTHPGGRYLLEITRGTDATELYESYHAASLQSDYIARKLATFEVKDGTATTAAAAAAPGSTAQQQQPPDAEAAPSEDSSSESSDGDLATSLAGGGLGTAAPTTSRAVAGKAVDFGHDWVSQPVYSELKEVVRGYRREHGIKATDHPVQVGWYTMWAALHYLTLFRWACGWGGPLETVLFGLSVWFWCGDMLHSGTHYALTYSNRLSGFMGWFGGWMFCLPTMWVRQHVVGHHSHTNVDGYDPDLYHWETLWRVKQNQVAPYELELGVAHRAVRWLGPLLTQLAPTMFMSMKDIVLKRTLKGLVFKFNFVRFEVLALALWWAFVMTMVAVRSYHHGASSTFLPFLVTGIMYYAFSQVSHINTPSFDQPPTNEWCVAQIIAAQGDYQLHSRFWSLVSNGLHNQTMHHCFPSVHPCHYPALSLQFKPVFEKHGLPTQTWTNTFFDSLRLHVDHLRSVNRDSSGFFWTDAAAHSAKTTKVKTK